MFVFVFKTWKSKNSTKLKAQFSHKPLTSTPEWRKENGKKKRGGKKDKQNKRQMKEERKKERWGWEGERDIREDQTNERTDGREK